MSVQSVEIGQVWREKACPYLRHVIVLDVSMATVLARTYSDRRWEGKSMPPKRMHMIDFFLSRFVLVGVPGSTSVGHPSIPVAVPGMLWGQP
jgi:hypothetical protein